MNCSRGGRLHADPPVRAAQINYCRVATGKKCGFVQYDLRQAAETAIATLNGAMVQGCRMRLSWGKSAARSAQPARPAYAAPACVHADLFARPRSLPARILTIVSAGMVPPRTAATQPTAATA